MLRTTGSAQLSAAAVSVAPPATPQDDVAAPSASCRPYSHHSVFGLFPLWSTLSCGKFLIVVVRRQVGGGQPREVAGKAAGVRLVC